jgi:hypothetical protein
MVFSKSETFGEPTETRKARPRPRPQPGLGNFARPRRRIQDFISGGGHPCVTSDFGGGPARVSHVIWSEARKKEGKEKKMPPHYEKSGLSINKINNQSIID